MKMRNQIAFYQQRGQQLEQIIFSLYGQLQKAGIEPKLPLFGIQGDEYLNDIHSGEFAMQLLCRTCA